MLRGRYLLVIGGRCCRRFRPRSTPSELIDNIGNFTSYIGRLFHLDSGALVWTDPVEWYWGLWRWLRLLGETLLMAYVGTILGAVGAFVLALPRRG